VDINLGNPVTLANNPYDIGGQTSGLGDLLFKTENLSRSTILRTDVRRLTTGILSEKCIVRRFRYCANVIECTYTNLGSTV
jgi:hypothetical protein